MIGNSAPSLFMARPPAVREEYAVERVGPHRRWDANAIEAWIARHPVLCVSTALFAGAMVGWFIKRR
jgi:hypothetical protein